MPSNPAINRMDHPVWAVYNELRTARLNTKFEQHKLVGLKRFQFWSDLIIKASAASSIGGLSFMKMDPWALIWSVVGAVAVLLQIVQGCLRLDRSIATKQKSITAYSIFETQLTEIRYQVQQKGAYSKELQAKFNTVFRGKAELMKAGDSEVDDKLVRRLQEEVNRELPAEDFFVPNALATD